MIYFVIAFLVFVSVIIRASYLEQFPDGSRLNFERGENIALVSLIAFLIAILWPLTLLFHAIYLFVVLIHKAVKHCKDKHESN